MNKKGKPGKVIAAETPAYLPGRGYFRKMALADEFILADDVRFVPQSPLSRTLIRQGEQASWLTVPVRSSGKPPQQIREARIDNTGPWRRKHWRSLSVNYAYAPYREFLWELLEPVYGRAWTFLLELNLELLNRCKKALGIEAPFHLSSELPGSSNPSKRIAAMVRKLEGACYLADPEDETFLEPRRFAEAGIELRYCSADFPAYLPGEEGNSVEFSVVDLLMFHGPDSRRFL